MPSENKGGADFCRARPFSRPAVFMPYRLLPAALHIFSSALIFPYPSKY
ncbi:TPA: hypothetical protein ACFRHS_000225 [Neisseria lactamica]|nr:hypothetical protein [Neisseria lactamica]